MPRAPFRSEDANRRVPSAIRTAADIEALMRSPRSAKRLLRAGIVVAIPSLDQSIRDEFQSDLKTYSRSCGCFAGGVTFLIASAVLAVYVLHAALTTSWTVVFRSLGMGFICVVLLTGISKLLTLYFARLRFQRECKRFLRLMSSRSHDSRSGGPYDVPAVSR